MNIPEFYSTFSLFHHDAFYGKDLFGINSKELLELPIDSSLKVENNAATIYKIVVRNTQGLKDEEISLTLTGGMDSRLILACLLKAGIKPNCMTFGNPRCQDVVFARNLAEQFDLPFHNVCQEEPSKEWYNKWVMETIKRDNGNAHLHRAHRTAAIAEHVELFHPKILFTGHMGGEGLRGLTYNNYFSSSFFEAVNESRVNSEEAAKKVLQDYFLRIERVDLKNLLDEIGNLPYMQHDKETNKLFFLYDLVAKIHHAQDIRIYQTYIPKVVPVFLQKEYLEILFSSRYNFVERKNSFFNRLKNPDFYCKFIENTYPPLLNFPFSNGFTPREYLKGLWYYVPVKIYRDHTQRKKTPPTFSYGQWYIDFVRENAKNISSDIWEIYDKESYLKAINTSPHRTDEGYWHKFSNPIYFDLLNKYNKGSI